MTTRKLKALKTKAIKALARMEKYGEKIGDNEISWELDRLESEARKAVGLYASEAGDHCLSMFVNSSPTGIWSLRESAWVHVFYKPASALSLTFKIEVGQPESPHEWRYVGRVQPDEPLPPKILNLWRGSFLRQKAQYEITDVIDHLATVGCRFESCHGFTVGKFLRITHL